jgi:tRNA A37 threonylcarbamoyladenosine biosynthesis protein TsaE
MEKDGEKSVTLLHVDMYRMTDPMLLVKSGLSDIMEDAEYRCIEWPKYEWIDTDGVLHVEIEIVDGTTRKVRLFNS